MILHTGGSASGDTSTRSSPCAAAIANASSNGTTPRCSPSDPITRTSRARIIRLIRNFGPADLRGSGGVCIPAPLSGHWHGTGDEVPAIITGVVTARLDSQKRLSQVSWRDNADWRSQAPGIFGLHHKLMSRSFALRFGRHGAHPCFELGLQQCQLVGAKLFLAADAHMGHLPLYWSFSR